jgi:hypothetical protein
MINKYSRPRSRFSSCGFNWLADARRALRHESETACVLHSCSAKRDRSRRLNSTGSFHQEERRAVREKVVAFAT